MLLRLLQYNVVVKYTKGSALHVADAQSRAYVANGSNEGRHFSQLNTVVHLPICQTTMRLLRAATAADDDMQALKQTILEGWPESKVDINTQTSAYFAMRDELVVNDGLIFKGERVIVPRGMRKQIKQRLYMSHLGADSMLRRARECVFWPGMAADIRQLAGDGEACQSLANAQ